MLSGQAITLGGMTAGTVAFGHAFTNVTPTMDVYKEYFAPEFMKYSDTSTNPRTERLKCLIYQEQSIRHHCLVPKFLICQKNKTIKRAVQLKEQLQ